MSELSTITLLNDTISVLSQITESLAVGTNLGLLHVLWMLVSGGLLASRAALILALKGIGLSEKATRWRWRAVRAGQWQLSGLLEQWRGYVKGLEGWQEQRHEGYMPLTVDVTAFWRPTLKECPSQHYHPAAKRALRAVIFGLVGEVGEISGQRLALPRAIERVHPKDPRKVRLWQEILKHVQKGLDETEIVVFDAGVKISGLHAAGIERYVVRLATNFTAQRNVLPKYARGRMPTYGALVRPLARCYNGKILNATPPDECYTWLENGGVLRVEIWRDLVLPKKRPHPNHQTFDVYTVYDPAFKVPWLLATPVKVKPDSVRAIYTDRWPDEQLPLSARQMVGAHRRFVHNVESIQRLPELELLAGSLLSFLAATLPVVPTGFWNRHHKRTQGRLRRTLLGKPFPIDAPLSGRLREKHSATSNLPKGNLATMPTTSQNSGFSALEHSAFAET